MMDLRTNQWRKEMLEALSSAKHRELVWRCLPRIIDMNEPIGPLSESLAVETLTQTDPRPLVFPTVDDQAAGLIGGGAVDAGQVAIILGNSAVVNSSSSQLPQSGTLDAMKLNWGPYLWMRCYSNRAQFVDVVAGKDWYKLEAEAAKVPPLCNGTSVLPFLLSEPSVGVDKPQVKWTPAKPGDPAGVEPSDRPVKVRVSGGDCLFTGASGTRTRGRRAIDYANHGFRRHGTQQLAVRNSGQRAEPATRTARLRRGAGARRRGCGSRRAGIALAQRNAESRNLTPRRTPSRRWSASATASNRSPRGCRSMRRGWRRFGFNKEEDLTTKTEINSFLLCVSLC